MAKLIRQRGGASDTWRLLDAGAPLGEGDVIVPLPVWLEHRASLRKRCGRIGVLLEPTDDPAALAVDLEQLDLIAVRFPRFTDGRGYSTARLLRERFGYRGELRAVGDVLRDQLFYLSQVGFGAFALRDDQDEQAAPAAFEDFSESYQAVPRRTLPLFRRRLQTKGDAS